MGIDRPDTWDKIPSIGTARSAHSFGETKMGALALNSRTIFVASTIQRDGETRSKQQGIFFFRFHYCAPWGTEPYVALRLSLIQCANSSDLWISEYDFPSLLRL